MYDKFLRIKFHPVCDPGSVIFTVTGVPDGQLLNARPGTSHTTELNKFPEVLFRSACPDEQLIVTPVPGIPGYGVKNGQLFYEIPESYSYYFTPDDNQTIFLFLHFFIIYTPHSCKE